MQDTDRAWEIWGRDDAYYGVLTHDEFRSTAAANNLDAFFASGEKHIAERLDTLESLLGQIARGRALDFGSGVGRLAEPLARRFDSVVGLDISPSMLEKARSHAAAHGLSNLEYASSDDALSNASGTFNFVHTFIVLQHIPTARGMVVVRQLLDRVARGGVASLHVCVEREYGPIGSIAYNLRRRSGVMNGAANLLRRRRWGEPFIQMNEYKLTDMIAAFNAAGIEHVVVHTERHGAFNTAQLAGRKSG